MTGVVVQVSISAGGVPNRPIERGDVTLRGIVGDGWRHPAFHGIPKRAILLITVEGLDEIRSMGFSVYPGALGENLTTSGLDRRALRVGQRFRCGGAVMRLTELRVPCGTLRVYGKEIGRALWDDRAMKSDPSSEVWGLSGFYASVTEPGVLFHGDSITLLT
ncbi:MAG TPA: MOSC domain-containing protein [Bryobacteraceae bacterium]|jgi:MOSC domain-containing protein YiiM|nr:MOSC domain-containing protein [Bryobacteraceae bacterium]